MSMENMDAPSLPSSEVNPRPGAGGATLKAAHEGRSEIGVEEER